mmetsp:Transcript_78911/g.226111  ORF Transcript_78911/g.226111 Transcript_78911/m.226111 type:complete len:416 (+) Transcript_78911:74-1321(+)
MGCGRPVAMVSYGNGFRSGLTMALFSKVAGLRVLMLLLLWNASQAAEFTDQSGTWSDDIGLSLLQRSRLFPVKAPGRASSFAEDAKTQVDPPPSIGSNFSELASQQRLPPVASANPARGGGGAAGASAGNASAAKAGSGHILSKHTFLLALLVLVVLGSAVSFGSAALLHVRARILLSARNALLHDRATLAGCKTSFDDLTVNLWLGSVNITNFVVQHQPGSDSEYLLRVGRIQARIAILRMLCSPGGVVDIRELILSDVDVVVEFLGAFSKTNVSGVQARLEQELAEQPENAASGGRGELEATPGGDRVTIGRVIANDIGLRLSDHLAAPPFAAGRLELKPWAKTCGADKARAWCVEAPALVANVLRSLLAGCATEMKGLAWGSHVDRTRGAAAVAGTEPAAGSRARAGRCRQQ